MSRSGLKFALEEDHQHGLSVMVEDPGLENKYLLSIVHGGQTVQIRREMWENLPQVWESRLGVLWCCGGDFNAVVRADEKAGGRPPNPTSMFDFSHFVFQAHLGPVSYSGSEFTWSNKQEEDGSTIQT